jgi:DNA-binding YbaB/EbfC family protein
MFGKLGDLGNLDLGKLESAFTEMQQKVKESEAEAEAKLLKAKSGGGMVEVTINGKGEVVDIQIDPSLSEDLDSLQILLIAGVNDAIQMVKEAQKENAMSIVGNSLSGFGR